MNKNQTKKNRLIAACLAAFTAVGIPVWAAESDAVTAVSAGGKNETLYAVFSGLTDADVNSVSYTGTASGTLTGDDLTYLVRDTDAGLSPDERKARRQTQDFVWIYRAFRRVHTI